MPRSLADAINIDDLRTLAKRRMPKALFDFVDGGAEDEVSLRDNRSQFDRWRLIAGHPVSVTTRDLSVEIFGERIAAPFIISPTGLAALTRGRAEVALARGAQKVGIPMTLSTAASISIEDLARSAAGARRWFQLYIFKDREFTQSLIERAKKAGYTALVVSVDCPVLGQRERDFRNRMTIPLRPTATNVIDVLRRPGWLFDFLTHGVPKPENFTGLRSNGAQSLIVQMQEQFDPSVSWADIAWVRSQWQGPLIIKGIVSAIDARLAIERGVDGVVVSNQGGRQLDHAVPTLEALPYVVDAVGQRATVFCDGGFRRGTDVVKALALGAKAVFLGRATLFGVAAGGETGVVRALRILCDELDRAMALMGCASLDQIDHATIWDRFHDRFRQYPRQTREVDA